MIIKKSLNVKDIEELVNRELNNINKVLKNKKIKGIFSPTVYINTVKQVFDRYGLNAKYTL